MRISGLLALTLLLGAQMLPTQASAAYCRAVTASGWGYKWGGWNIAEAHARALEGCMRTSGQPCRILECVP